MTASDWAALIVLTLLGIIVTQALILQWWGQKQYNKGWREGQDRLHWVVQQDAAQIESLQARLRKYKVIVYQAIDQLKLGVTNGNDN